MLEIYKSYLKNPDKFFAPSMPARSKPTSPKKVNRSKRVSAPPLSATYFNPKSSRNSSREIQSSGLPKRRPRHLSLHEVFGEVNNGSCLTKVEIVIPEATKHPSSQPTRKVSLITPKKPLASPSYLRSRIHKQPLRKIPTQSSANQTHTEFPVLSDKKATNEKLNSTRESFRPNSPGITLRSNPIISSYLLELEHKI